LPVINGMFNLLRHHSFQEPFIATHTYNLDDVLHTLKEASFQAAHVVFENQPGFDGAVVFVQAPVSFRHRVELREIDVGERIARSSIDELNAAAEQYFASLNNWEHHLSKPFSQPEQTPRLLMSAATMLQGLGLVPGMTVLEFGAGTGWLARFLTQLGCRVV